MRALCCAATLPERTDLFIDAVPSVTVAAVRVVTPEIAPLDMEAVPSVRSTPVTYNAMTKAGHE